MKRWGCILLLSGLTVTLSAQVSFSGLAVDQGKHLVFSVQASSAQGTDIGWFEADLGSGQLTTLTFPVDTAEWLPKAKVLQWSNAFGSFRLLPQGNVVTVSPDSFSGKSLLRWGKPLPSAYSPEGAWALVQIQKSPIEGDLALWNIKTGMLERITQGITLSTNSAPALWSPNGEFFVYVKADRLYYYSMEQRAQDRVPPEALRCLGAGLLSSVRWSPDGDLVYVRDNSLWRLLPQDFYTLSLFGPEYQTWGLVTAFPLAFNPATDRFWLSPDLRFVLLLVEGRTLLLKSTGYFHDGDTTWKGGSYVPLPGGSRVKRVLWSEQGARVLVNNLRNPLSAVFQMTQNGAKLQAQGVGFLDMAASPDGKQVLLTTSEGLSLRNASDFSQQNFFAQQETRAAFWQGQDVLLCSSAGVQKLSLVTGLKTLLVLGAAQSMAFDQKGVLIAKEGGGLWAWTQGVWQPLSGSTLPSRQTDNSQVRVFLQNLNSEVHNRIMVRLLARSVTVPLLPPPLPEPPALKTQPESLSPEGVFTHGARDEKREIALVFLAQDSDQGLGEVLSALHSWKAGATFFVNGDFLRRHPEACREIAASGAETSNGFYIPFQFSSADAKGGFIPKGLARQEDDWHRKIGTELSPLWWPSVYSPAVVQAATKAGYVTVGTDLKLPVPVGRNLASSVWIDTLLKSIRPGAIVPLTLGVRDSKTGDSFFRRLDLLLDALKQAGYSFVSVSKLREHSLN
ncbi:MAG: hypothetical protein HKM05_05965 [Spirochaetales bacterium]|nr:hypothetical protein [Spirochaetales bacterium]